MPAIKIASKKKITLDIVDENNKTRGQVSFDPSDIKVYNAFAEIATAVMKIDDEYAKTRKSLDIPEGKLGSVDEYKQTRDKLVQLNKFTNQTVEQVQNIAKQLDDVFGPGSSDLILQGSYDVELIAEFIQGVMPYFEDAKRGRIEKYINSEDAEEGEVM